MSSVSGNIGAILPLQDEEPLYTFMGTPEGQAAIAATAAAPGGAEEEGEAATVVYEAVWIGPETAHSTTTEEEYEEVELGAPVTMERGVVAAAQGGYYYLFYKLFYFGTHCSVLVR